MRRVECTKCQKIVVEKIPWSDGKNHLTHYYCKYLADWAKEMAWKTVANRFHTSWQTVHRAVKKIVAYGLQHRRIDNVTALGIDEVQYHKGHKYMTLVYQIDKGCRRLLWVGQNRTKKTLRRFFADMWNIDRKFRKNIRVVCTDMWKAYLHVIKEKVPNAINVLDKFHIMQKMGKALDKVRASEAKRLKEEGKEVIIKGSRWCFLKRKFNLTKSQKGKLKELVDLNLNIVKAYILKEQFHKF
jgi:transposase